MKTQLPDVILMDIQLPQTDGLTLVGILKRMPGVKDIPIALTVYASSEDKDRALWLGAMDLWLNLMIWRRLLGWLSEKMMIVVKMLRNYWSEI